MKLVPLRELMPERIPSVDPSKSPDETFELWSIPSFDKGSPEIVEGSEIGSSKKCIEPGDVLLSRIVPHIRRSWVVETNRRGFRQIASGEWITFRSDRIYPAYLRHVLISDPFHAEFMQTVAGVGGSLVRARPEGVKQIKIPLPPLEEQKRIAAILDQADGLRRLRQRAIDRLNKLGQAIFYEMFGDDEKQGKAQPFGELVENFRYGTSNKSTNAGYPTLRIPNVIGGRLDLSDLKTVSVNPAELTRLKLKSGDVLFVRTNGNPDYVGRSAVFEPETVASLDFDPTNWIYASYLIRARLRLRKLHPDYLQQYLTTSRGRRALRERCKTSAGQFNINTEGLGSLSIPVPEIDKQHQFAEKIANIRNEIHQYSSSANKFDSLFSSLQHRAFRGEL